MVWGSTPSPSPASNGHLERRGDLAEQRVPGADRRGAALGEHALLGLRERVRREAAQGDQVVAVAATSGRVVERPGGLLRQREPLQVEEPEERCPPPRGRGRRRPTGPCSPRWSRRRTRAGGRRSSPATARCRAPSQLGERLGEAGAVEPGAARPGSAPRRPSSSARGPRPGARARRRRRRGGGRGPSGPRRHGGRRVRNRSMWSWLHGIGEEVVDDVGGQGRAARVAGPQLVLQAVEVGAPGRDQTVAAREARQ